MSLSSSPRRKTLCTDDARDIVPQLLFSPPQIQSEPRRRAPRPADIDSHLAESAHQHKFRPLPTPPTPKSAPPAPHQQLSRTPSMRPLPCLPESGPLAISVTPATPLPPPTPTLESDGTHLSAPHPRPGPPRFSSLSLRVQTSPDALKPRAGGPLLASPVTPLSPEPPSPRTAQRKRISKLRRHLGESVQVLLEHPEKLDALAKLRHGGKNDSYPDITVEKVLELDSSDSDTLSSDGEGDDALADNDYFNWRRISSHRVSQKWIRERGKERWTEANFSQILQDLRAL
ncbi:hypothetical protein DFH06DRAFT_1161797 [Mycena polygramma]|nr:hypothetical protein DFH06DRAFT_1161797 [Mycena polygramma]